MRWEPGKTPYYHKNGDMIIHVGKYFIRDNDSWRRATDAEIAALTDNEKKQLSTTHALVRST